MARSPFICSARRPISQCIFESTNCNFTEGLLPCSYSPSAPIFSVEISPASETRTPRLARRTASRPAGKRQLRPFPRSLIKPILKWVRRQWSSVRRFLMAYGLRHKSPVSSNSTRSANESLRTDTVRSNPERKPQEDES